MIRLIHHYRCFRLSTESSFDVLSFRQGTRLKLPRGAALWASERINQQGPGTSGNGDFCRFLWDMFGSEIG